MIEEEEEWEEEEEYIEEYDPCLETDYICYGCRYFNPDKEECEYDWDLG